MKNHSCQTQQLLTIENHSKTLYGGTEIDVVLLWFICQLTENPVRRFVKVTSDVSLGTVLSPLVFLLFLDDIPFSF